MMAPSTVLGNGTGTRVEIPGTLTIEFFDMSHCGRNDSWVLDTSVYARSCPVTWPAKERYTGRESVQIYDMLGITSKGAACAADLLRKLEIPS
jgi:hypothetical protein